MKNILGILSAGLIFLSMAAQGAFTSMYIFADSLSSTTNNVNGGTNYDGYRWCNGPVWVEYLAQHQGIPFHDTNNTSGFGFTTTYLTNFVAAFPTHSDATNALFVLWGASSDLFFAWAYNNTNDAPWETAIDLAMTNTAWIIQNLYAKGARTLILPDAVNIGAAPAFGALPAVDGTYLRDKTVQYNVALSNLLVQTHASLPAMTIYSPDFFSEFEKLLADPAAFGFATTNVDALNDSAVTDKSTNGPGANHIFWDPLHPTTKVQTLMAQQLYPFFSLPLISHFAHVGSSNQLVLGNLSVGTKFILETSTNLVLWQTNQTLTASNATQTVNLQTNATRLYFRLKF